MPRGRPISKYGEKKAPKKFKSVYITYAKKKEVIECFDEVGMQATLDIHYGHLAGPRRETARKKFYGWLRQRQHILDMASAPRTAGNMTKRTKGMGTTLPTECEEQLAQWVRTMRGDGVPVTARMLQIMALEYAIDAGFTETEFYASWHWMQGFKKRFNLSTRCRTRTGQCTPADGEAALEEFSTQVKNYMEEHEIDVVYNADQTGVNYEYLPTKTQNARGENTVWERCGGKTKDRATAMVLGDSNGTKYPLFVVVKTAASKIKAVVKENIAVRHGFGKSVWKTINPLQETLGCQIYGNPSAWWNSGLTIEFLRYHFSTRVDLLSKVLLLLDDFSGHFSDDVLACAEELNVKLMKVPPRYTWVCQPADVAWIRPMKVRLRNLWIAMIKRQVLSSKRSGTSFQLQPPKRKSILKWIADVWSDLPRSVILNGFAKCRLIRPVDNVPEVEVPAEDAGVDDAMMAELVASCSIDETIDLSDDIAEDDNISD
ncbi:Aste57867_19470 [Aphanomyces stellatus]|uniref:Aste57867_19470 protein n=1 Tax=Aphanomyces stellatus TaxID=120398 RepID=A0A485LCW8_9STRA|nr:hypothetical protein As57867_019406 [Aphanomyces stellatus]VFT96182.1 Aste57867_19470 [Aphanomyces stellatus]